MTPYTYRMYGLVPYNISPIQQGIQFGHAVVEYGLKYSDTPQYKRWSTYDKTFIILNGGTTNTATSFVTGEPNGTLNRHLLKLVNTLKLEVGTFHEPDLGDQLTAVVFLVDERVWDKETYPDYEAMEIEVEYFALSGAEQYEEWKRMFGESDEEFEHIMALREFLTQFKLA